MGALLAVMAAQPKAIRVAYRARHWACALDILELAAMAASARAAAASAAAASSGEVTTSATARESAGGMPLAERLDDDGGAATSWFKWSRQLMKKHKECVSFTQGMHDRL